MAQAVKCLSSMQETWVRSLGWEDPLEKEMAIHSSTIAWKIPWTEEPGKLQPMGSQRVGHDLSDLGGGVLVRQSYSTLCDPTDNNPPHSSVHGIVQARIQE